MFLYQVENTGAKLCSPYRGIVIFVLSCYKQVAPTGAFLSDRFFPANGWQMDTHNILPDRGYPVVAFQVVF